MPPSVSHQPCCTALVDNCERLRRDQGPATPWAGSNSQSSSFQGFLFEGIPVSCRVQGLESIKTVLDLYRKGTLACLVPQPFKIKDWWPLASSSAAPKAKPECCDYESMIRVEELCTPIDTTVLHEPPSSTDKNMVNLLFHQACVGVPTQPA